MFFISIYLPGRLMVDSCEEARTCLNLILMYYLIIKIKTVADKNEQILDRRWQNFIARWYQLLNWFC